MGDKPSFMSRLISLAISLPWVAQTSTLEPVTPELGLESAPQPTEGLLRAVCAVLDARRLLSTELYAIAPR
mgnify:CR=1 FL=1